MSERDGDAASAVDRLAPGDHVCWIFDDDEQCRAAMARFVAAGLDAGQKVLYVTERLLPAAVIAGLAAQDALAAGQLQVCTADELYLPDGRFDPARTIDALAAHVDRAARDGYAGLRVVADMAWARRDPPGVMHLARFEAQVNKLFLDVPVMACLYDRRLFEVGLLRRAASAHPSTSLAEPAGGARSPVLRLRRTGPASVRLAGEADAGNRLALSAVLGMLIEEVTDRPVRLDVSALSFLDAAAAGVLARAAAAAPAGLTLTGCGASVSRVLTMTGAADAPGLQVAI
jgi:anti-anti-sigma factor